MIAAAVPPRIVSVGTAHPATPYTQQELLELFRCEEPKIRRFFSSSHIQRRFLVLPKPGEDGTPPDETGSELLDKHLRTSLEIGWAAIDRCLASSRYEAADLDYFTAVTSTGFLCPGLTAYLSEHTGMRPNVHRADIVGMGCNAAVNGMIGAASWAATHPGSPALMLSCEVCSAAYVFDMTVRTGVVNSLFGDAAAAALLVADEALGAADGPALLDFESFVVHPARDEMRFDFEEGKFSFFLGWEVPYLIGENVETPVDGLLRRHGLKRRDIDHWAVHSGGKKVVDAIKYNLGITAHDVRHTSSILRDFGNVSSGSVLFSLRELAAEGVVGDGDLGVLIAMGPGVSIETALLRW